MKPPLRFQDWLVACILTGVLHLEIVIVATLPFNNYFFPFLEDLEVGLAGEETAQGEGGEVASEGNEPTSRGETEDESTALAGGQLVQPYLFSSPEVLHVNSGTLQSRAGVSSLEALQLPGHGISQPRSLAVASPRRKMAPPDFSPDTIPPKPTDTMSEELDDTREEILLGDIFKDAVPATYDEAELAAREEGFLARLAGDIADGHLDMPFSEFIIPAEYYQLSYALLERGMQPSFSLADAVNKYRERLARVTAHLPDEVNGFGVVMILQKYAENKFYPGNGSGMLLDALFHDLNDCEGGTKEVLSYLGDVYPSLKLGTNRGLLRTTTGDLIGHMQVYIESSPETQEIIENDYGVVLETTRIGRDSVQAYSAGDVYPLVDFVIRYYPRFIPIVAAALGWEPSDEVVTENIVGTSNHPLKMAYTTSGSMLSGGLYDLENIRTQRIANEFQSSSIPECDPRVDPTRIDRTNLFSNFVTIAPQLRKSLIDHYLADLDYWDNRVMPQWHDLKRFATYEDLAATLVAPERREKYISIDGEYTAPASNFATHRNFLLALEEKAAEKKESFLGKGENLCSTRAILDDRVLSYLFSRPEGPGVYFLDDMDEGFSWSQFARKVLQDCVAIPAEGKGDGLLRGLEKIAREDGASLRKALFERARLFALSPGRELDLKVIEQGLTTLFTGAVAGPKELRALQELVLRQSPPGTREMPSVTETITEKGRRGVALGLLYDLADFFGAAKLQQLVLEYGRRNDLEISVERAVNLVAGGANILSQEIGREKTLQWLEQLGGKNHHTSIRLAAAVNTAEIHGVEGRERSESIKEILAGSRDWNAEILPPLLGYGLFEDDAVNLYRSRLGEALAHMVAPERGQGELGAGDVFIELMDWLRLARYFDDAEGGALLFSGIAESLINDFNKPPPNPEEAGDSTDLGLLFNKLYLLALQPGSSEVRLQTGLEAKLLDTYFSFAANVPAGKLMASLVVKSFDKDRLNRLLGEHINRQFATLATLHEDEDPFREEILKRGSTWQSEYLDTLIRVVAHGNIIYRLLSLYPDILSPETIPQAVADSSTESRDSGAEYLQELHRRIGGVTIFTGKGSRGEVPLSEMVEELLHDFYLSDVARDSFSLLAHGNRESARDQRLKFRKIRDIRSLKDLSKVKVIPGGRKVTRQDMSLLTLALNSGNSPSEIAAVWHETSDVTEKHLNLDPPPINKQYLFAPHAPYLTESDRGFYFSPELIADVHNASKWGGRNDILLSSYLHFRNLPANLPEWLLQTAMTRSSFERNIIEKFEQQSFLPMILECSDDLDDLSADLFRAKWMFRKPFGEDIFPGTLLLLRLGYMAITGEGEIVLTSKYTDR